MRKGKIKNIILKTIISIVFIIWALLMFTYDSWTGVQMYLYLAASLILGMFLYVNKEYLERV